MALLHGITVLSTWVNLPPDGGATGATMYFELEGTQPDGTKSVAVAHIPSTDFPTDQTTFMSKLWTGAFLEAFDAIGQAMPDDAEWSPWPIV